MCIRDRCDLIDIRKRKFVANYILSENLLCKVVANVCSLRWLYIRYYHVKLCLLYALSLYIYLYTNLFFILPFFVWWIKAVCELKSTVDGGRLLQMGAYVARTSSCGSTMFLHCFISVTSSLALINDIRMACKNWPVARSVMSCLSQVSVLAKC